MVLAAQVQVQDDVTPVLVRLAEAVHDFEAGDVYVGIRGTKGSDLVLRAMVNEFGTERIPERSFLRSTMDRRRDLYLELLEEAADRALDGRPTKRELEQIGAIAVGDVRDTIARGVPPPNAPSTIARKGSSHPLIDTGRMWQSLDAVVELGGEGGAAPSPTAVGQVEQAQATRRRRRTATLLAFTRGAARLGGG